MNYGIIEELSIKISSHLDPPEPKGVHLHERSESRIVEVVSEATIRNIVRFRRS